MFGYKDATLDEPYIIRVEQLWHTQKI
jgi:hypothetical protein